MQQTGPGGDGTVQLIARLNGKRSRLLGWLLWTVFWVSSLASAHAGAHWDAFISEPNRDQFARVKRTVLHNPERCDPSVAPTQDQRTLLFDLIRQGNEWALRASLLVTTCWGGGELEDFYRSAGTLFEVRPLTFLQIGDQEGITDEELGRMLTMLPLDLVDDLDGKIAAVDRRIRLANGIRKESVSRIAARAVSILQQRREALQRVRAGTEKGRP
jgi:hypothetical protein